MAVIFALLSFTGFESGIPLAEETKDPGRALTFSVVLSVFMIGVFYVLLGYASAVGWGGTSDPATYQGHMFKLPVVGDMAEKQANAV